MLGSILIMVKDSLSMYYRDASSFLIIVSLFLGVIGFWYLWKAERKKTFFKFIAIIVAYPVAAYYTSKISDDHLRLWIAIPVACLLPVWLLIGFFIYRASEVAVSNNLIGKNSIRLESESIFFTKRRIFGLVLSLVGAIAWLYGATHPEMSKSVELVAAGLFMYGMLIGLVWLVTGKKIEDID